MWVRPALTSSENSSALRPKAPARRSMAGRRRSRASSTAARWTADGKTSFDDWPMFTWSLAWTSSPARLAITSLVFMFDDVPEPVWNTSIGNWSSCSPAATSSPARAMRSAMSASSRPSSALTRAAAAFIRPSQWTTGAGTRSPDTGKFSTAFIVSLPHSSCRIAMSWRLSAPASRLDAPPVRRAAAAQDLRLLLEPPDQLAALAALLARAAAGGSDQVAEAELGPATRMGARGFREPARCPDQRGAHRLQLVGVAGVVHAGGQRGPVEAHRGGCRPQGRSDGGGLA